MSTNQNNGVAPTSLEITGVPTPSRQVVVVTDSGAINSSSAIIHPGACIPVDARIMATEESEIHYHSYDKRKPGLNRAVMTAANFTFAASEQAWVPMAMPIQAPLLSSTSEGTSKPVYINLHYPSRSLSAPSIYMMSVNNEGDVYPCCTALTAEFPTLYAAVGGYDDVQPCSLDYFAMITGGVTGAFPLDKASNVEVFRGADDRSLKWPQLGVPLISVDDPTVEVPLTWEYVAPVPTHAAIMHCNPLAPAYSAPWFAEDIAMTGDPASPLMRPVNYKYFYGSNWSWDTMLQPYNRDDMAEDGMSAAPSLPMAMWQRVIAALANNVRSYAQLLELNTSPVGLISLYGAMKLKRYSTSEPFTAIPTFTVTIPSTYWPCIDTTSNVITRWVKVGRWTADVGICYTHRQPGSLLTNSLFVDAFVVPHSAMCSDGRWQTR